MVAEENAHYQSLSAYYCKQFKFWMSGPKNIPTTSTYIACYEEH